MASDSEVLIRKGEVAIAPKLRPHDEHLDGEIAIMTKFHRHRGARRPGLQNLPRAPPPTITQTGLGPRFGPANEEK